MTTGPLLLAAALAVPLVFLLACASPPLRNRMPELLALAPLAGLAAALWAPHGATLTLPPMLLSLTFVLDKSGAMLLGATAFLWSAAGACVGTYVRSKSNDGGFCVWWLMTLTGNIGVFLAADLIGFYLLFTLASLAAYGLIAHDGTPRAARAAALNIGLAVLCEALLLMGFVLMAAASANGSLLIRDAVAALPMSPWRDPALALILLGFALKIGLVPLHVWMPLTYSASPIPAAAVLSGAAVKAGVIGLIRFLPFDTALSGWGEALAAVGLVSAYYGVLIGITQTNAKTVLAYSSVSQMGLLAAVFGMGLSAGDPQAATAAAFSAVHHVLVKGGLFLAVGAAALSRARSLWPVLLPAAVLALGLAGLPLTGGALAKLAVKSPLGDGIAGLLANISAIGSTVLMLHFLRCLTWNAGPRSEETTPASITWTWLAVAFAAVAVPWALYPEVASASWRDALSLKELWSALWPVLVGCVLAAILQRKQHLLPQIPEGDVLAAAGTATRSAVNLASMMERIEAQARQWPIAGLLFLVLFVILAGTMFIAR